MMRAAGGALFTGIGGGVVVGLLAVGALNLVRRRVGIRRDYESLYGFGVAVTAFAAAEAIGGSGFLAAFAAGLTIAALDVELCECFFDYGQATAELVLLFTFVTLGSSGLWRGLDVVSGPALLFAAVALFARGPMMLAALVGSDLDLRGRLMLAWFGPRGLSSLLLVLLPVFAGLPEGRALFPYAALTVLLSVVVHGAVLFGLRGREQSPAGSEQEPIRLSLAEVSELQRRGEPVQLIDVRTERGWQLTDSVARGAVRVDPARPVESAAEQALPKHDWLVAYCA
jgi:NhaP-type Na+/H+ and K+/H+ antiporter